MMLYTLHSELMRIPCQFIKRNIYINRTTLLTPPTHVFNNRKTTESVDKRSKRSLTPRSSPEEPEKNYSIISKI